MRHVEVVISSADRLRDAYREERRLNELCYFHPDNALIGAGADLARKTTAAAIANLREMMES